MYKRQVLIKLTEEFSRRFREEKKQRNLIDFNDQEHFALNILLDKNHEPTPAAKSYSEQFEEIMCDEYPVSYTHLNCSSLAILEVFEKLPSFFKLIGSTWGASPGFSSIQATTCGSSFTSPSIFNIEAS